MKVCDKTCIFFFFPIINKYFLMAKRSLLSRCPSYLNEIFSPTDVTLGTPFLEAFAKLRKETVSFVCPPAPLCVCTEQPVSHWTDFHGILYLNISLKFVQTIPSCIKIG